jgi:hypothetical protein
MWQAVDPQPHWKEHVAPEGTIFVCRMCGKTTTDIHEWKGGWDESCALNAVLCHNPTTPQPRTPNMPTNAITVTYETPSGDILECRYLEMVTPGFTSGLPENCYPDECEIGDPEYYLNDEFIAEGDIPADLVDIAQYMYESGDDGRFKFSSEPYDDRPDDYDF